MPAHGTASFTATLTVPLTVPLGLYEGELLATDPGTAAYPVHTTVIPVAANVAAAGYSFTFGDVDQPTLYDNGNVYGFFDWNGAEESGDWRFFSTDVPDDYGLPEGTSLLVHTTWENYPTDLDTLVLGPAADDFSDPGGAFYLPDTFGPYTLEPAGGSERVNPWGGLWFFRTNTGTTEEWAAAPLQAGLHTIALHNVLYNPDPGMLTEVPFSGEVGTLAVSPTAIDIWTAQTAGSVDMTAETSLALPGLAAAAYGLSQPLLWSSVVLTPTVERCDWTYEFTVTHAGYIEVSTSSPDIPDVDLFLYWWNGTAWDYIAVSANWTANEYLRVTLPSDGRYRACIDDYSEQLGHVDVTMFIPADDQLWLTGVPTGTLDPGQPVSFTLQYSATMAEGDWYGVVFAGPPAAPGTLLIPVTIHYKLFRAYLPLISR